MSEKPESYKSTPVFDETTLPAGLRREHRTKAGVWGVIRVLEGRLRYRVLEPVSESIVSEAILDADNPGYILPEQPHLVATDGPMRMRVDFFDRDPRVADRRNGPEQRAAPNGRRLWVRLDKASSTPL